MAGYKYFWTCPNCRTTLQLKMRVTQTTRKCPQCGFVVTPEEIDKQKWYGAVGGFIIVGLVWVLCATPSGTIPNFFYGLFQLALGITVIVVIAFVLYVGYKIYEGRTLYIKKLKLSEEEVSRKKADKLAFDAKKVEFLGSSDFQLVRGFVRSELRHEDEAEARLHSLLQNKGWNFTFEEVKTFVTEETNAQIATEQLAKLTEKSAKIADQIRAKNPDNREAYLKAYAEASHPHEDDYLHVIAEFLKVPEQEQSRLKDELLRLSERSNLDEFERRLRSGSSS